MAHPGANNDVVLARDRTELAWSRSGLAMAVCVALLVRRVWPLHGADRYVGLGVVTGGAFLFVAGILFGTRLSGDPEHGHEVIGEPTLRLISLGTIVLATVAVGLGVFAPGN